MNIRDLRDELAHRLSLDVNDDFALEECWKKMTKILSESVDDTIKFLNDDCSDEEFFWLSEVYSDVSEMVQSKQFVHTLRTRLAQVARESYNQKSFKNEYMRQFVDYDEYIRCINMEIRYADGALNDE